MTAPRVKPGTRSEVGVVNAVILKIAARASGGKPPNVFSTLARNRGLFRRWLWFAASLMPGGRLPRRETELVILRVAFLTDSEYERRQHEGIGARAGLDPKQIEAVRKPVDDHDWSAREELVIRATDALHADRDISAELWERLEAEFDQNELVELCMLVGHYEMLAMTLNALRVEPDETHARLPRR